ncbi:MAG: DoxX family protein [Rhizomicrobium sp.]
MIAFLIMDFAMKLADLEIVRTTGLTLGWQPETARLLGAILAVCTALYAYPRTAILGAVLLTGYLGGAVATHLRVDSPLFSHILFGVYLGVLAWGGLWLRDAKLQALFPLRRA